MAYKCSVCGLIGNHKMDCYAGETTNMMDAVDYPELESRSEFFHEPTAHEAWILDRVPRGSHYDPADDGPETDSRFMMWVMAVIEVVTNAAWTQAFTDGWLNSLSHDFYGSDFDILTHGRE